MPNSDKAQAPPALGEVKRRFDLWRKQCRGPGRVPAELQRLACQAASQHGVESAAGHLQLKPERLQRWMRQLGFTLARPAEQAPPEFIELPPLPRGGLPDALAECHLEVEEPSGRKLRLCLKGPAAAQAAALAPALWGELRR